MTLYILTGFIVFLARFGMIAINSRDLIELIVSTLFHIFCWPVVIVKMIMK